ncbi:conserved protein of unknown function [Acidithiobacillus ferrivorans]|uniref:Uncharacterized protein n=1 Tax=Acidithiobacillus ferrivorans TaxID=160808 RepID=A0A060UQV5_9PROT|nr:hypothetical protein [Acidithiobacillus ferrivorans]CDQ09188.1 conserved hypothetical protein [Acidithiobacillus ferrivorans]SMH64857.1 conserved protein of unknown function [Acidithiobacillus ferrivorans]
MALQHINETKLASIIAEFFAIVEYCSAHGGLSIRETDGEWQDASAIMARETGIPATRVHNNMIAYAAQHYGADWLAAFTVHTAKPSDTKWNIRTLANVACEKVMRPDQHNLQLRR